MRPLKGGRRRRFHTVSGFSDYLHDPRLAGLTTTEILDFLPYGGGDEPLRIGEIEASLLNTFSKTSFQKMILI